MRIISGQPPISPGEKLIRPLSGLSGSTVWLVRSNSNHLFVRKVASSPEASLRLEKQVEKIKAFQSYDFDFVLVPQILNVQNYGDSKHLCVDFEYIHASDLIDYVASANSFEIKEVSQILGRFLISLSTVSPTEKFTNNTTQAFYDKVADVVFKCQWLSENLKLQLFTCINRITKFINNRSSLCHGDLTFENILITRKKQIYLIDHLDSFYPYYWQDVSKLHQDLSGEWFRFCRSTVPVPKYALLYMSKSLLECVCKFDQTYSLVHNELLAITFARILPYAKSPEMRGFLSSRIVHYLTRSTEGELAL